MVIASDPWEGFPGKGRTGLRCPCLRSVSPQAAGGERGTLMHIVGYAQGIIRIKDGLIEGSEGGLP